MATDTIDEFGPVDYLVVEFPGGASHLGRDLRAGFAKPGKAAQ